VSVCAFALVLAGLSFLVFTPKKGGSQAPATIGNTAAPKAEAPQDFLSVPAPSPDSQGRSGSGDIVVVYGDKPTSLGTGTVPSGDLAGTAAPSTAVAAEPNPAAAPLAGAGATAAAPTAAKAAPTAASAAKPASPAKASAVKPASKPSASAATKTPAKAVQPAKKAAELWIQVASFTSRGKADDLKDKLAQKGMSSLITVKDISGKSWYRVRIGPYSAKAEADGWLAKVKAISGCEEAVVMK
jgi:cell division septation protein DedD